MTEHEAAKPKRPRDLEFEDAPTQESIRGMSPRVIKRNPSSDQKRVRREMQRKIAGEETELSRLLVEAAAVDNPFGDWKCKTPGCNKYDGMSAFRGDDYCKSCMKKGEPDKQRDAEQARKRSSKTAAKPPAESCKTCGNLNFTDQGSCTRCGRVKTAAKTAANPWDKPGHFCSKHAPSYTRVAEPTDDNPCETCGGVGWSGKTAARPLPTYPGGGESTPSTEHSPGDVECRTCGFKGAPALGDTGKTCRNCNSYSVQNLKQRTAEKTTRATCPDCGVGLIWGECPNCGYKVPDQKRKTGGAAGTYAGPSPTGGFHHWMSTGSEDNEDQCISCGVVAPDVADRDSAFSDHGALPIHCPGPDGAYNAHHFTHTGDGELDCAYCGHQIKNDTKSSDVQWECLSHDRGPIPADHPNAKRFPEHADYPSKPLKGLDYHGSKTAGHLDPSDIPAEHVVKPLKFHEQPPGKTSCPTCGLSWDDDKVTSMTPVPSGRCPFEYYHDNEHYSSLKVAGKGLAGLEHGDEMQYSHPDHPDYAFKVRYYSQDAIGDNGQPARGYVKGGYEVEYPNGKTKYEDHGPFRPGKDMNSKAMVADRIESDIVGKIHRNHLRGKYNEASLQTEATAFDTQADKLNPGDMIRTPTGQTVKVLRMRNHETSPGHAYMDTDQGTSVVRRKAPVQIVPFNSQQQELPGYGIPGGNTNKLPLDPGNVGPSKQTPSGTNQADPNRSCPVCGGKGTLARRGQSYVCSKCGYRENVGAAGPGKGFDFTDAPQRLMRSSSLDQQSAIARRAQEVLETTEEIQ